MSALSVAVSVAVTVAPAAALVAAVAATSGAPRRWLQGALGAAVLGCLLRVMQVVWAMTSWPGRDASAATGPGAAPSPGWSAVAHTLTVGRDLCVVVGLACTAVAGVLLLRRRGDVASESRPDPSFLSDVVSAPAPLQGAGRPVGETVAVAAAPAPRLAPASAGSAIATPVATRWPQSGTTVIEPAPARPVRRRAWRPRTPPPPPPPPHQRPVRPS